MSGIDLADSVVYGHLWATPETRELFGDEGRTRTWLRDHRGARPRSRPSSGIIPRRGRRGDRAARRLRRPRGRRRGDARDRALDARADPRAARATSAPRPPSGSTTARRSRTSPTPGSGSSCSGCWRSRARPGGDRGRAARPRRRHRDTRDARPHARPARPADHVRLQGRGVGGRGAAPPRARRPGRAAARGRPARGRGRHALGVGRARAGAPAPAAGPARARRARHELARRARPDRRVRRRCWRWSPGTLAKIGNEVYNLQRPEIGELSEAPTEGVVGSITMPQKRNPERSEHLWTLARVVRAGAGLALEGLVGEHERDGAAWKTEWAFLPQASAAAAAALALRRASSSRACASTQARMRANLDAQRGYVLAEPAMLALAARVGKHRAHELVHRAALAGLEAGVTLAEALAADPEIAAALPATSWRRCCARARARRRRRDRRRGARARVGGADEPRDAGEPRRDAACTSARAVAAPPPGTSAPTRASAAGRRRSSSRPATSSSSPTRRCCTAGSGSPTSRTCSRCPDGGSRPTTPARCSARCWSC